MLSLDPVVGLLAPHLCISCGREGSVLCGDCLLTAGDPIEPRCGGCHALSKDWKTCSSCRSWLDIYSVIVATRYEGVYEQLIYDLKFNLKRQASIPVVKIMLDVLDSINLPADIVLCPLPTAPKRIRERGFDHAKLISRQLSACSANLRMELLLSRKSNIRQLGSSRSQRIKQMEQEFFVKDKYSVKDRTVLLIDDVMTTGASLSSASKVLKNAGAKRVYGLIFAQKV